MIKHETIIRPLDQFEIRNLFGVDTPLLDNISLYINQIGFESNIIRVFCLTLYIRLIIDLIFYSTNRTRIDIASLVTPQTTTEEQPDPDRQEITHSAELSAFLARHKGKYYDYVGIKHEAPTNLSNRIIQQSFHISIVHELLTKLNRRLRLLCLLTMNMLLNKPKTQQSL